MSLRHLCCLLLASSLLVAACSGQASPPDPTIQPTSTTISPTVTSITISTTLAPTTTATTTTAPPAVVSTKGLIYATGSYLDRPVEWKADLHIPAESGNWPALVFLPGQGQGTNSVYNVAEEIAAHGVVVLVIDYADRSPTSMPNNDARGYREVAELLGCGIRFVQQSAEDAGGEPTMLAVGGMSNGGGAAAHAALAGDSLDRLWEEFSASRDLPPLLECVVEEGSTHVDALVGVSGPYDVFVGYEGLYYGREYLQERDLQLWELLHGALELNPDLQVRLLHGGADTLIPYENSEGFVAALAAVGIEAELSEFEGGHSLPHDETVAAVLEVLGLAGPGGS